jgi:hypothetical protein
MMPHQILSLEEHFASHGPKRILALDGGGVRGILSLGFLTEMESLLRSRHGNDPNFRLCHYFDLIAGTSTGSIIAALLAKGWAVDEVIKLYQQLAGEVFAPRWWEFRLGALRPRYRPEALEKYLKQKLGSHCCIGDQQELKTGLLVMCKRIDSGSPWPISNNPHGKYYHSNGNRIANSEYKLWQIVRASTAAPTFFKPLRIDISAPGKRPEAGEFMDGGVSPHNNPSLQAYWLTTLQGYGLRWPTGQDKLLIISVGTGRTPVSRKPGWIAALQGITALQSLMDDCGSLVETVMQGMGHCLNQPRIIDPELSTLSPHQMVDQPRFSYARYDVKLYRDLQHGSNNPKPRDGQNDNPFIDQVGLSEAQLKSMQAMDNPKPCPLLYQLGHAAAMGKVQQEHFPAEFDLPMVDA